MGRTNLRNTMYDCPLSTECGEGQLKKTPCTIRPLTTAMTDGYTLNPSVQAESTLFGYFAANTKKANFSLFKYTLRYIDVQEGGTPAGRGDSNKSRPLRFLPPLRYSSSSKYGVRKQIWIQIWFIQYEHFPLNTAIFSILVKPWSVFDIFFLVLSQLPSLVSNFLDKSLL